jgi:hypothetical protein
MLHLFDDLWLDKLIPKNNDKYRAIYDSGYHEWSDYEKLYISVSDFVCFVTDDKSTLDLL